MSEPIVFISTHKIKDGKLDALKESYRRGAASIEADKPDTVAFLADVNEEGSEVSTVHVFPDSEAMERHMEGVGERANGAAGFLVLLAGLRELGEMIWQLPGILWLPSTRLTPLISPIRGMTGSFPCFRLKESRLWSYGEIRCQKRTKHSRAVSWMPCGTEKSSPSSTSFWPAITTGIPQP